MKKILFVLLLVISLLIILPISFNNSQEVIFNYLLGETTLPLSWLIFASFFAGTLIVMPFFAISGWIWKKKAKSANRQIDDLLLERKKASIEENFLAESKVDLAK